MYQKIWKVKPVLTGKFGMVRDDIKYRGGNPGISEFVPSVLFLLDSGGEQVIVDTGFGDADECSRLLSLKVERNAPYEEILGEAGICPMKVSAVVFTHLHWDHAGMAQVFSNADFYCHELEWNRAVSHPEEYPAEWMEYLRQNKNKVRIYPEKSEKEIMPGISVRYTGGHTYGSQMVLVQTKKGRCLITGDVVMTNRNYDENIPVGLCVDERECDAALELVRQYKPIKVYPSHDFSIFKGVDEWEL